MLGESISSVGWPKCGEIDIMEHTNTDNKIFGTVHWDNNNSHAQYGKDTQVNDAGDWHIYTGVRFYKPIWKDEFDGSSLDPAKWNIVKGNLKVNDEKQFYQEQNVQVVNGQLVITAKKETVEGQPYTSGRINTQGKFNIQYGIIEARIKLPLVQGLWPAFWMLGESISSVGWPKCGEIDIMEHTNTDNKIFGTVHWDNNNSHAQYGKDTQVNDAGDWHIYTGVWDANSVKVSVDGQQYFEMDTSKMQNFHEKFYILLNLAVGGQMPGNNIDDSKLPAQMIVDWVHVCNNE